MVIYKRASNVKDLEQILELQRQNLPRNLSAEDMQKEGFVTVEHTLEILQKMNAECPHIIATYKDRIIAYALCMHPIFRIEIEVLRPMFEQIDSVLQNGKTYITMGQICIDKNHRRKGVFRNLYKTMKEFVLTEFDCIVTEVDSDNTRSLTAHYSVGFKNLKTYEAGGQKWELIILKLPRQD